MKKYVCLLCLLSVSGALLVFSAEARQGALDGLVLSENTVVPSLLPLLIIFLMIIKTGAGDALSRMLGWACRAIFRLPECCAAAIILGMLGGYPTGALLTRELFEREDIDGKQARRLLSFNFCGGCGFIITAVGVVTLGSKRLGLILLFSNIVAALTIGVLMSFGAEKPERGYYSFKKEMSIGDALVQSVDGAVKSVLAITAYIMLFSAIMSVIFVPKAVHSLLEITGGICGGTAFSLPLTSAFLSFGGLSIHLQLLPVISRVKMKYSRFFLSRLASAVISYVVTRAALFVFPTEQTVFSSAGEAVPQLFSVNMPLSFLLIAGCFVLVLDLKSRRRVA